MKKILVVSLMAVVLLTLTACGKGSEKDRFVNASVEVGCAMFQDENFFKDFAKVESKTKEIFTKYDFNVENEDEMKVVSEKYQQDEEVLQRVQEGITKCAGNIFNQKLLDQTTAEEAKALETATPEVAPTETPAETPAVTTEAKE